jgi:hypothetical protein
MNEVTAFVVNVPAGRGRILTLEFTEASYKGGYRELRMQKATPGLKLCGAEVPHISVEISEPRFTAVKGSGEPDVYGQRLPKFGGYEALPPAGMAAIRKAVAKALLAEGGFAEVFDRLFRQHAMTSVYGAGRQLKDVLKKTAATMRYATEALELTEVVSSHGIRILLDLIVRFD